MITSIIRQQLQGTINLSLPFFVLYFLAPQFALGPLSIVLYSLGVGLWVGYITYIAARSQERGFLFMPTGLQSQQFHDAIIHCGLDPKKIAIRYAYADDAVALTFFTTVVVDPFLWGIVQEDPEAVKAREVVGKHILPAIPENKKELHKALEKSLSVDAQWFIFRHELAHVFYHYSYKRVVITGVIGIGAAGIALTSASYLISILGGLGTALVSITVGAGVDLVLAYATNFFFKSYEEKRADIFAARFSSREEIERAADFFEQYEKAAQCYRNTVKSVIYKLPTTILTGYIDGIRRAQYLRALARLK